MQIEDSEQFDRVLNALANELVQAHLYYQLFQKLNTAFGEYAKEIQESKAFWALTRDSLRESALTRLCRVYDSQKHANSLSNVLQAIKDNPKFFEYDSFRQRLKSNVYVDPNASYEPIDPSQLAKDIEFSIASNPVVRKLIRWRNTMLAHRNSKQIATKTDTPTVHRPTYGEVEDLLHLGMDIINRYSGHFRRTSYTTTLFELDDFEHILGHVRTGLKSKRDELRAEVERMGLNWSDFVLE